VNVGLAFVAHAKTTKGMEPCVSTRDEPAKFAETTAVVGPARGGRSLDAAFAKFMAKVNSFPRS
jgi:hypothetical protein